MLPFVDDLDAAGIHHVQAPTNVIFLCGGQCSSINDATPLSLRDAFLKISDNPAINRSVLIQAEEITSLSFFKDHYRDLLRFETDLAQISELILLFCESEGSLAELGAFAVSDEIAKRLLVIIRDKYWEADSFVRLGPLRYLENNHGSEAVYVIDDLDINMRAESAADVRIDVLKERLQQPLRKRLEQTREPTTFDQNKSGHIIKLIVGIIQEYGALTADEITDVLSKLNIDLNLGLVGGYLLCAEAVMWIAKKRKGWVTFYVAKDLPDAATLSWKPSLNLRDKVRRRFIIRQRWSETDQLRSAGIRDVFGGSPR